MNTFELAPQTRKSFYGKATVKEENGLAVLTSYDTEVATYNIATEKLTVKGWYSSTTARHINAFLTHYGLDNMSKQEMLASE